jgi:lipid-A-disaccharide synthase
MVVTGEASGDRHAAGLIAEIQQHRPDFHFFGMGGPRLAERHVDLIYQAHEISVMGFTEVFPKVPRILGVLKGLARSAGRRRPRCAILVDIPDFNLRLARKLNRLGIPVIYYISPMVWAWRPGRLDTIAALVNLMLCILPFEEQLYRRQGIPAIYVGNPVLDQLPPQAPSEHFRRALNLAVEGEILGLLPGSRPTEVSRLLPSMLAAVSSLQRENPRLSAILALAPMLDASWVNGLLGQSDAKVTVIPGQAAEVIGASNASIVASGTATLEAALMARPFVVVYRVSLLNEVIGRALLKVSYVSLPNILLKRPLVPELLQRDLSAQRLAAEVKAVLSSPRRDAMLTGFAEIRQLLGAPGASRKAAQAVLQFLSA